MATKKATRRAAAKPAAGQRRTRRQIAESLAQVGGTLGAKVAEHLSPTTLDDHWAVFADENGEDPVALNRAASALRRDPNTDEAAVVIEMERQLGLALPESRLHRLLEWSCTGMFRDLEKPGDLDEVLDWCDAVAGDTSMPRPLVEIAWETIRRHNRPGS